MITFARIVALCLMSVLAAPLQPAPEPGAKPAPTPDPAPADLPSKADVAKKMVARLTSSPVLHITMSKEFQRQHFESEAWMTKSKSRGEVRKDGKVVFATSFVEDRVQEFAPWVEFKNGENGKNVLVEYDAEEGADPAGWPRLIPASFACGPGAVGANWLTPNDPINLSVPAIIAQVLEEPGELKGVTLNNHDCYWMHAEITIDASTHVTKDLYIDQTTFEPVRDTIVTTKGDDVIKSTSTDYQFEYLQTEDGIAWRLDVAKLKQTPAAKR